MSIKTYWRPKDDGSWEFLSAWPEKHKPNPNNGVVYGSALIHPDIENGQVFEERRGERTILSSLPSSIRKHLMTERESVIPFEQIDGYLKGVA